MISTALSVNLGGSIDVFRCTRTSWSISRASLNLPGVSLSRQKFSSTSLSKKSDVVLLQNKLQTRLTPLTPVELDSLRVLEWHKLCDCVAAFAGTIYGKVLLKDLLFKLNVSYEESLALQSETNAAVEMLKFGVGGMDFSTLDVVEVESAIDSASRGSIVNGHEAMALVNLLRFSSSLQVCIKAAIKEDIEWYRRFMPLSDLINEMVINQDFVKFVLQVVDEDGNVKDSASSDLRRSRNQVRLLERKLHELMDTLLRNEMNGASSREMINIDGRWCIKGNINQPTSFQGLLLSLGSGADSYLEPISAIPLNDDLAQAKALVVKAEQEVLSKISEKMRHGLDGIRSLLESIILLDAITARAKYSLAFGGTCPDLFCMESKGDCSESFPQDGISGTSSSYSYGREWTIHLLEAYHPLLLHQHQESIKNAKKDVNEAAGELRRRRFQSEKITSQENLDDLLRSLKSRVTELEAAHPIPVDFLVYKETKVLVITGPNTGGKTISLKTIGLASLMAKAGLYVLASEPARIPWFDSVLADIGDEQSLTQSLSTFSGHLKQIHGILMRLTNNSLVLLDEVGAGTNPLEGAALAMALLESLAESAQLTLATTHHGELKTLKYSNNKFENACVEFDEANLKPTYKILWGVPGRSNAINIAERLGLPHSILNCARELYGTASAEINKVIIDMEKYKQDFQRGVQDSQHSLVLSKELYDKLVEVNHKITELCLIQRQRKIQEISEYAAGARSILHDKLRRFRVSAAQLSHDSRVADLGKNRTQPTQPSSMQLANVEEMRKPEVGKMVHVPALGKRVKVVNVDVSKEEIIVQTHSMKLRLRFCDVKAA
ncbi:uncharacterized protein LOC18436430 isoform X3 [Amborella trichopoda]|uniref:DNA mismatch repair proteins mutS family domain-containing protein n=1 Tax=Amborella trichopoda TaxID=13333 RepID=W1PJL5_AMBTC|nr:uncharacterized protein LOC18436430 isoform X3 [Amborella trichopoda]ERN08188.1 hypothetical protein AMTR_s00018p00168540 [Amborella trichopoda]|eukprot:XP_006846513.1 uncharacterized protein LOC18436430 isoform X3 [Amborella trichopoda]